VKRVGPNTMVKLCLGDQLVVGFKSGNQLFVYNDPVSHAFCVARSLQAPGCVSFYWKDCISELQCTVINHWILYSNKIHQSLKPRSYVSSLIFILIMNQITILLVAQIEHIL